MLDDGQDGSTLAQSKRSRISRLILATLVGALLGHQFGWKAVCAWIAVSAVLELVLLASHLSFTRNVRKDRSKTRWERLAPAVTFSLIWTGMAVGCWIYGSEAARFGALLVMFGILLEGL